MTGDYTTRVPAEILNEIINRIDKRADMHSTAHVCRRWRYIALSNPRRHCWFKCRFQYISRHTTLRPAALMLCVAQLKCRLDHPKRLCINLDDMAADVADTVLGSLARNLSPVNHLSIDWDRKRCTEKVFRALSSHPAPGLTSLALRFTASRSGRTPRIPETLFAGSSPALRQLSLSYLDLPEAPVPQFAVVEAVAFDPAVKKGERYRLQDLFASHFPSLKGLWFALRVFVPLAAPTTAEGKLFLGRLTRVEINEKTLLDAIDGFPGWFSVSYIEAHPYHIDVYDEDSERPVVSDMLERMLADFAHEDFRLEVITPWPCSYTTSYGLTITSETQTAGGRALTRKLSLPLTLLRGDMNGIFDRARANGHELRLRRATLAGEAFTALWTVLPTHKLRGLQVLADPALPDVPPGAPPRTVPKLRNLVIARHPGVDGLNPKPLVIQSDVLSQFLRATIGFQSPPRTKLRLSNVSADGLPIEVASGFTQMVKGGYLRLIDW